MSKKSTPHGSKNLLIVIILVVAATAAYGYLRQSSELNEEPAASETPAGEEAAKKPMPKPDHAIFKLRSTDIVTGKAGAPVTVIEYGSLSCSHCAHFYRDTFPKLKTELIDSGKVIFAHRHFPLNEPALRAAQVVECSDQREAMLKTLYENQSKWAFDKKFIASLKTLASVGGMDSARFDSCVADATLENKILAGRMEAANVAQVASTPSFFINGVRHEGGIELKDLRDAIAKAGQAPAK